MKITDLKPADYNPRQISDEQLERLRKSLREFGDLSGIVFNRQTGNIVGGHQRIKCLPEGATISKKYLKEPSRTGTVASGTIEIDGEDYTYRKVDWDIHKEKAANLAANKHGGDWDNKLLIPLLKELSDTGTIDMDITGFDRRELESMFENLNEDLSSKDDLNINDEIDSISKSVTQPGDIYILGNHKLICGDARDESTINTLLDGRKVDMILTDPPYGVNYKEKADYLSAHNNSINMHRAIIDDNEIDFQQWTEEWIQHFKTIVSPYNTIYIFMSGLNYKNLVMAFENHKQKGKQLGRPKIHNRILEKARELRKQGMSFRKIEKQLGVGEGTA
jgi:hypothetical protein